ncbi:MAG: rhodanese-like domain-containing protein [Cyclobacteriaceae bacterium]|nr:rhodanese-like domain-containing protein [Cyclobacteriaceae bacterium]
MKNANREISVIVLMIMMMSLSSLLLAQSNPAPKSAAEMVKAAKQQIENLTPQQVQDELAKGNVVLIDIRETEELKQNGKITGAVHAPRGMLEFYADPSMPYYKPEFDKSKRIILHCASGGRSALATATLKQMGYENVAHMDGGFKAWKESGKPVVE